MRRLLLDTHVALWALSTPNELAPHVRAALEDPRNEVVVSAASVWEVEIKRAIGKLDAPDGFGSACAGRGFDALEISFSHAEVAGALPLHHGDPFDRMLIAQALVEGLELVTKDPAFAQYGIQVVAPS
ncbi:MAG: type II toxin-antitoxin system VapC family toxin [Actinomycetota bacterium]|nr:type II toxin-antitoxin system VapC family toxin [Actinomycetota bacterium]